MQASATAGVAAVALFTSAWIETLEPGDCRVVGMVALFTSAWIETSVAILVRMTNRCRALHERVD